MPIDPFEDVKNILPPESWPRIEGFLDLATWKAPHRQTLFWIDSLCIPNNIKYSSISDENKERIRSAKAKAINSMAQLYARAENVLVLDPELRNLPSDAVAGDEEMLALYIRICPWMARSWPLQEGALAQNLYFQLKDRLLLLRQSHYNLIGLTSLKMLQYYREYKTELGFSTTDSPPSRFVNVWNSLVKRTTTEAADLPAILAVMMNCSAEEVLKLATKERMKALLKTERSLPLALFYQPNSFEDDSWTPYIPGSDIRQNFIHELYGSFRATDQGFVLEHVKDTSAIILDVALDGDVFTLVVKNSDGKTTHYFVSHEAGMRPRAHEGTAQAIFLLSNWCFQISWRSFFSSM